MNPLGPDDSYRVLLETVSAPPRRAIVISIVRAMTDRRAFEERLREEVNITLSSFSVCPGRLLLSNHLRAALSDKCLGEGASRGGNHVVSISGIDELQPGHQDDFFDCLNRDRDILAEIPAVLVFWLTDSMLGKLARKAPFFREGPCVLVDLCAASTHSAEMRQKREDLVRILTAFPACLKREPADLRDEADVQRVLWTMLRSHYEDLVDEGYLKKTGTKHYRYDFAIRKLRTIVEVKYVRASMSLSALQDQLFADARGYFVHSSEFNIVIFFIYDAASRLADNYSLREGLLLLPEVFEVIVVPYARLS